MKSLAISEKYGWARYVAHQAYYSLISREYEWELMPLGVDQKVATVVWSPLGWGRLTGKIRRGQPLPEVSRQRSALSNEDGAQKSRTIISTRWSTRWMKSPPKPERLCLRWRSIGCFSGLPSLRSSIGARNEEQLRDNLGSVGWSLTTEQVQKTRRRQRGSVGLPILAPRKVRSKSVSRLSKALRSRGFIREGGITVRYKNRPVC